MGSDIAKVEPAQGLQFNFFDPVQFETIQRVCKLFASSDLVPDMYKTDLTPDKDGRPKNPENKAMANCMIATEIAQRIGASPLMIMQNMVPIYGKPSWSSKFLVATVNTCGRFNPLRFKFINKGKLGKVEYTEYNKVWVNGTNASKGYYKNEAKTVTFDGSSIDDIECVAWTTARGAVSDEALESSPVSVKMAVQEGWYTKNGSKWPNMTQQMLMYRAASFWTSAYAPELSMGMKTEYEMMDITDVEYEDVSASVKAEMEEKANKETITITNKSEEQPPKEEKKEPEQPQVGGQRKMGF
jgi:hypothetical protein